MFYDDIYHYGIPGQRHGRRRYQNPDGSLTPAGRARYLKGRTPSSSIGSGRVAPATSISKDGKDSTNVDVWKTVSKRSPYVDRRTDKAKLDSGSASRVNRTMQQIKRPNDSNKPSNTNFTKQSTSGPRKSESSRAEFNRINSAIQAVAGMSAKNFNAYMTYGESQEGPVKENDIYRRHIDRVYDMASRMGLDDLPNVQNDSWDRYFRNMGTKSVN